MCVFTQELCREVGPYIQQQHKFLKLPVEKKVLMTIWTLANQDVYRKIGNLFNTSRGGAHSIVSEVCSAISKHLKPVYIQLPISAQCESIAAETEIKYGFPGVAGFIDGTHIPIKPPSWDRDSYINRKGYPSVNVLAACDHKMRFIYVYTDRAGSVHDARVLRVSNLGDMLETGTWPSGDMHVLGDSAYPLLSSLLVPYRDNGYLNAEQRRYNTCHSSARSVVERAFGRLKGKFRRLKGIDATTVCNALQMIETCFVMHNFVMAHEDDGDTDDLGEDEPAADTNTPSQIGSTAATRLAKQKRDRIAAQL